MLAEDLACGGAGDVHGDVAAADDEDFFADGEAEAEVDVEEEVDAFVDAIEVYAGDGEVAAAVGSDGDKGGVEVAAEVGDGEVTSCGLIEFEVDVSGGEDLADLGFDDVAGESVLGQAEIEHATGDLGGFEEGDGVAHEGEVVCGGEADGAGADDGDAIGELGLAAACVDVDGVAGLGAVAFGEEALECADGDGFVDFTTAAGGLAGMGADAAADAGHGIGLAGVAVGLFEVAFGDEFDVATCVGMGGAGHHAGKVGIEPIPVHLFIFEAVRHAGLSWLRVEWWRQPVRLPPRVELFGDGEVGGGISGDFDGAGFGLHTFVPGGDGVGAIGYVFDFEFTGFVGFGEVGGGRDDDVGGHLGVDVAEEWDYAGVIELEGLLLSFGPGAEVVSELLVAADGDPEDVVGYGVAVEEVDSGALSDGDDVGYEHQAFLVDQGMLCGWGEGFSGDGLDVDDRDATGSGDFTVDGSGVSRGDEGGGSDE